MKRSRSVVPLMLILGAFVGGIAACGSDDDASPSQGPPDAPTTTQPAKGDGEAGRG